MLRRLELLQAVPEAASDHALMLLPRLRLIQKHRLDVAGQMERMLDDLSKPVAGTTEEPEQLMDVAILRSLPGIGRVVAATLLAEASQAIAERDYEALRSYAGIAPVTRRSGNKKIVVMREDVISGSAKCFTTGLASQ